MVGYRYYDQRHFFITGIANNAHVFSYVDFDFVSVTAEIEKLDNTSDCRDHSGINGHY